MRKIIITLLIIILIPAGAFAAPAKTTTTNKATTSKTTTTNKAPAPVPGPAPITSPVPSTANPVVSDGTGGLLSGLSDLLKSITDLPMRLIEGALERIGDLIYKGMSTAIINNLKFYLSSFASFLQGGDNGLFSDPTINAINDIMKPVAYSIMTILFLLGVSKATINLEIVSTEVVLKYGLMLVITKIFVDKSSLVLQWICNANNYLTVKVVKMTSSSIDNLYDMSKGWADGMAPQKTLDSELGLSFLFVVFGIIALLAAISMFVVLILRQIHLSVMICAAPLFFATMVADVGNHVFRNYLMHFIASVFQTTFMAIALSIFCGSIKSYLSGTALGISGGFIGMMIGLIGLSFYIVKTPSTINNILGAHGGGGGINVASIASLFARV